MQTYSIPEADKYLLLIALVVMMTSRTGKALGAAEGPQLGLKRFTQTEEFLYRPGLAYSNYAFEDWIYPDILTRGPFRNHYGPLGDYVFKGSDVFSWRETRSTEHQGRLEGSQIIKGGLGIFEETVVVSESQKGWRAKLIIANEIRSTFTPLTLALPGLNGVRLDAETRNTRFSIIGSRFVDPVNRGNPSAYSGQFEKRNSGMMFGGHGEVRAGTLTFGATGLNFHLFDSRQDAFELRGQLQSPQTLPSWLLVRFSDDSPEDGRAGAVVSEVRLMVNGVPRPDLQPVFVRTNTRNPTAVGRTSRITGKFTPTNYPDGGTKFADYFYLREHLKGEDVSSRVNLDLLLRFTEILPGASEKRADGDDVVVAFFDLSEEPYVGSARVEAMVGNDYRVEVVGLHVANNRANTFESRFRTGPPRLLSGTNRVSIDESQRLSTLLRAKGNVQDLSNLRRISLDVGAFTGRTTLGLNGSWETASGEVKWEYARSVDFFQYADGRPGFRSISDAAGLRVWKGERNERSDEAYYVTGKWGLGRFDVGGELYSIGPNYNSGFIVDNDDDDRWPDDINRADYVGTHLGDAGADPDGVFPGKDEDNDGIPDTNRNGNDIPDYDEPFLLFDVEPDEYVYGRDWNHNGVVDYRENDFRLDFPYNSDQEGHHLFGRVHFPRLGASLALGQQKAGGIAFGGKNNSTYGHLTFEAERAYWGHLKAETLVQWIRDDIEDPVQVFEEILRSADQTRGWSPRGGQFYRNVTVKDRLEYRDSVDWQYYVEGEWSGVQGLHLWGNVRYEVNRQQGASFTDGTDQAADRLSLLTAVAKAEYVWEPLDRWQVIGQWKGLRMRRSRESLPVDLVDSWTSIPILKVRYQLAAHSTLQVGMEGIPGLPLKERDRADSRLDEDQVIRLVQLSNQTPYFGYLISMNLGVRVTRRTFLDPTRAADSVDVTAAFMRVFLGFDQ